MLMALAVVIFGMGSGRESGIQPADKFLIPDLTPSRLLFFGDIMLGRNVEVMTEKNGQDWLFEKLDSLLLPETFIVANLEGPIVTDHTPTPTGSFSFSFLDTSAELLARHNFDAVSLANNHTLNQGDDGFVETQKHLANAGVEYVGHPIEMGEEYVLSTVVNEQPLTIAGFNMTFAYNDPNAAVATIASLTEKSEAPIIVVMHWGEEYQPHSNKTQQDLAHRLIDAGANLIIGAHPHVVQEVESYNDKLIFYSLGNFIFDQYFSVETQQGLAVGIDLTADGLMTATLYPLESVKSQPALMTEPDRSAFLSAIASRSSADLAEALRQGEISF